MASVAKVLRVNRSLMGHSVRNAKTGKYEAEPSILLTCKIQFEVEQLRRVLSHVKMERSIHRIALGYFAKDPTWNSASLPNIARCGRYLCCVRSSISRQAASMNGSPDGGAIDPSLTPGSPC